MSEVNKDTNPDKSIIRIPELQIYMKDYGHVDDETPSLAISLYKEYIMVCEL